MHILLIEPDMLQAKAAIGMLEGAGYTVSHARSAQVAVQAADAHMPDAVVLELQLPRHNGVEFLYEFRSYPEWLHIPIVLYTAVPSQALAQAATLAKELGVVRVLHKPAASLTRLTEAVQLLVPGGHA